MTPAGFMLASSALYVFGCAIAVTAWKIGRDTW